MPTYNSKIVREQGGSILNLLSGASENILSGAGLFVQSGGCATFNVSGAGAQTLAYSDGTVTPTLSVGRNIPTHVTSPGALYIRSDGSMSNLYFNISSGTTGSVWRTSASG